MFGSLVEISKAGWSLRRSGIFGQSDDLSGGVPVVMLLQQLATTFNMSHGFIWSPSINIKLGDTECESDLVVITSDSDGKIWALLGECKDQHKIEAKDAKNLLAVAQQLENIGLRCGIVFFKLGSFAESELRHCRSVDEQFRRRSIPLSLPEVEPFWMQGTTSDGMTYMLTVHNVSDLIGVAQSIYYAEHP
jgi:hypothetical protein